MKALGPGGVGVVVVCSPVCVYRIMRRRREHSDKKKHIKCTKYFTTYNVVLIKKNNKNNPQIYTQIISLQLQ